MIFEYSKREVQHICRKDEILLNYINKIGELKINLSDDYFESLASSIIRQMLSKKVADCIESRIRNHTKNLNPYYISSMSVENIRNLGVSAKKAQYLIDLSFKYINNKSWFEQLKNFSDVDLINELCKLKGIGVWTAEMFSLFTLGRMNVWSWNDVALKNGILKVHSEFKTISRKRFDSLKRKYDPFCSVAAIYYYYANDHD